ncbi:MAG: chromosomal replication initiator protein DnaA [Bacteriovoracaceae bacterium]|nr:chromosomal replication initiator protein DnaA [Bacteriovoracaceae bacterium]
MSEFPFQHFFAPQTEKMPIFQPTPPVMGNDSNEELSLISNEILEQLKHAISEQKYNSFFAHSFSVKNIDTNRITFYTTTGFIKKMITSQYLPTLEKIITDILGKNFEIEILSPQEIDEKIQFNKPVNDYQVKKASSVKEMTFTMNELLPTQSDLIQEVQSKVLEHSLNSSGYGHGIDKDKTFANFIVGPSNNMAHASAIAVSKKPAEEYPCLYLHGNSGLGKTHLIHAIANYINENFPQKRVYITTANEFMSEMIDAIKEKKIQDFRKKYSETIDVLMVDDIHELKNRTGTQDEFFHVFNELHHKKKQLIFTSDKHPREIDGIEERIKTRLSWGLVIDIQQPDLETRIAILKSKAESIDSFIPNDVINLIARSVKTNIRDLEGSLIRLGAYSSLLKVDIDLEIAKTQLKLSDQTESKEHSFESIARAVSNYYKVPIPDMRSKSRLKEVTQARHVGMYLSYSILKETLANIGKYYGNRDHTTVVHAVDKVKLNVKQNTPFQQEIFEIESRL